MSEQAEETTNGGPKPETYNLTLTGGGLSVNREVDEATAFQIVAVVMGGATLPRVTSGGSGGARAVDMPGSRLPAAGRLSLREHMDKVEPKRNPDKILAIAAYLTDTRERDTFTPDDVKKEFKNASEPVPANYSRDWRWAVSNGWIAKADEAGEFYITVRGRDALSQKFSADVKRATAQGSRRRRTRKKAEDTK
jgi:hypothetical protein